MTFTVCAKTPFGYANSYPITWDHSPLGCNDAVRMITDELDSTASQVGEVGRCPEAICRIDPVLNPVFEREYGLSEAYLLPDVPLMFGVCVGVCVNPLA